MKRSRDRRFVLVDEPAIRGAAALVSAGMGAVGLGGHIQP